MVTILCAVLLGQLKIDHLVPELQGDQWLNTEKPIKLADRKGKVTLVHFWTFASYNCKNNLPAVKRLTERFKKDDVITIGVHTPEIEIEKDFKRVTEQTKKLGIEYPVLFDGKLENWNAWKLDCWPTLFVIDKKGRFRAGWRGELNFNGQNGEDKIRDVVIKLLAEK